MTCLEHLKLPQSGMSWGLCLCECVCVKGMGGGGGDALIVLHRYVHKVSVLVVIAY